MIDGIGSIAKNGTGTLSLTGSGDFAGPIDVQSGTLHANGLFPFANPTVQSGASLQGNGTLGNVTVASGATLRPGNSPGQLTLNDLDLNPGSQLVLEIAGPIAGSQYDQVRVANHAILDGQIEVQLINGYVPQHSDVFDLILYNTRSGSPAVTLPLRSGSPVLAEQFVANAYRLVLVVSEVRPTPTNPGGPPAAPPIVASRTTPVVLISVREEVARDDVDFDSVATGRELQNNVEATPWLEQPPALNAMGPPATEEGITLATVIDEIFAEGAMIDLSSLTTDVRPYAEVDLESAIPPTTPPPPLPVSPATEKTAEVPFATIFAGTAFIASGLSLLVLAIVIPRKLRRRSTTPPAFPEYLNTDTQADTSPSLPVEPGSGVPTRTMPTAGSDHE